MRMANEKRRIVLELDARPKLREVIDRLHEKTGMKSAPDLILVALLNYDAILPPAPLGVIQPDNTAPERTN